MLVVHQQASTSDPEWWTKNHGALKCLVADERMLEVYQIMEEENFSEDQMRDFIIIAWSSFEPARDYQGRINQAHKLLQQIRRVDPKRLADLIQRLRDTGAYLPPELLPSGNLSVFPDGQLGAADLNLQMLRWTKATEDRRLGQAPPSVSSSADTPPDRTTEQEDEKKGGEQAASSPGSEAATHEEPPDIVPLLEAIDDVVAVIDKDYLAQHLSGILETRQRNQKTDYIRSFAQKLIAKKFRQTPNLENAITITATVALGINDPHVDVSLRDVRTAYSQMASNGDGQAHRRSRS
jgi:hypothetical protein